MGYRSDWKLIFNTAGKADEVMKWLIHESGRVSDYSLLVEEMLKIAITYQDADVIELGDGGWKLWGWDDFTCAIHDKWGDDDEVDYAWAKVGEETDDIETCSGDWTCVYIERSIGDSDLSPVPKAQSAEDLEAEAKPRPSLKCTCGGFGICKDWCDLTTGEYTDGIY